MLITWTFDVVNANAAASTLTGGIAALPRSTVGCVNAVEYALRQQSLTLGQNKRVLVGVENYQLHSRGGVAVVPRAVLWRPWKSKGSQETPLLHELQASYTVHIAVLSNDDGISVDALEALQENIVKLPRVFAGGAVFPTQFPKKSHRLAHSCDPGEDRFSDWLAARGGVSFITHRPDLLEAPYRLASDQDRLDTVLRVLSLHRVLDEGTDTQGVAKDRWKRVVAGWIIPLELGFAGVHAPVFGRPGARDAQAPCVVASSVLSLGECVQGRRLSRALSEHRAWWFADADPEKGLYCLKSRTK